VKQGEEQGSGLAVLRAALDAPEGFDRYQHRARTEDVRHHYPHTVAYRELVEESTCVTYALKLFGDRSYRAIASNFNREVFAGRQFVEWLLQNHLTEMQHAVPGCLALYFHAGVWKHVGVVTGEGRIISQWGTFPVYEHAVLEVPARYGDQVRYFEMLGSGDALRLFLEFCKAIGLSDWDIANAVRTGSA